MNVEQLVTDALREQADAVRPDPAARAVIARRLEGRTAGRRATVLAAAGVAAAVAAVAVAATLLAPQDEPRTGAGGRTGLPGYPLPSSAYFPALEGGRGAAAVTRLVIVRVADGSIVAHLPLAPSGTFTQPQLTPDGTRAYGVWGRDDDLLGYLDLRSGRYHQLVHRPGELSSPTVSADGATLAYQWDASPGATVAGVVIRDLRTGAERVVDGVPSGAQATSLALSPDGSQLALVPTDRTPRPLWLISTRAGVFADPTVVTGVACRYGGWVDEPRWTSAGLFAVRHCHSPQGTAITANVLQVDAARHHASQLHRFAPGPVLFVLVVVHHGRPLFVTWNANDVNDPAVYVRDPQRGWAGERVRGVSGLDVSGSE